MSRRLRSVSLSAAAVVLAALAAHAATRARYGGSVRLALASPLPPLDPLLADSPAEAAVASLSARGVCRLDRTMRLVPDVALELGRPSPGALRIALRPGLQTAQGTRLGAAELAESWARLSEAATASPYRALLAPIRGEARNLRHAATSEYVFEASLAFPWPDLEKSLCHPALALAAPGPKGLSTIGPFVSSRGAFAANLHAPLGRPYVDKLAVLSTDERGATREFAELKHAEIALGSQDATSTGPLLYATYLAFRPERVPAAFRQSVQSTIDPSDLTRFFVRAPAVAMSHLLPPPWMPNDAASPIARPAPEAHELTLSYDGSLVDQRLVAERIQIRLHDLGYRIQLKALPRATLRAHWASGDFDAMLHAVLLPPLAAPAFALVLDVAGRRDLLATELPAIGAVADSAQRDAKVRERALALEPSLPLIPLYAQGLAMQASPRVEGLTVDAYGLPTFDDAFLTE